MSPRDKRALSGGGEVMLTTLESRLLASLASASDPGRTRVDIEMHLWGSSDRSTTRRLDILIWRLRQKIMQQIPDAGEIIPTRHGKGYALTGAIAIR